MSIKIKFGFGKFSKIFIGLLSFSFLFFGSAFVLNAEKFHHKYSKKDFLQHYRRIKKQNLRSTKLERKTQTGSRIFSTVLFPFSTGGTKLTESCFVIDLDWSGSNIIFTSSKDNDYIDVFRIPSSGGDIVNLTNSSGGEWMSRYSSDGNKIYYNYHDLNSGTKSIRKMNSDGTEKVLIKEFSDSDLEDYFFCVSPDGNKIAYLIIAYLIEGNDYISNLWVMNNDGTNCVELATAKSWNNISFSRDSNFIVFRDVNYGISKVNVNTKEVTQLTDYGDNPDWSPVEDKILYTASSRIYVINSDGTGKTEIAYVSSDGGNVSLYSSRWSPDGSKIGYIYDYYTDTHTLKLWVINADGSNKTEIVVETTDWGSEYFVWSPDSDKIAYSIGQNIFVVDCDGANKQNLTNNNLPITNSFPRWNGNYTKVAYIAKYPDGDKLMVMDSNGSNKKELDSVIWGWGGSFSFYPHSTKIVYSIGKYWYSGANIFTINSDGTGKTQLTSDGASIFPSWSPDLSKIAYYSGGYLKIMDADGSNQTTITEASYNPPFWSSDGKEIAYIYGNYWDNQSIWIVDVSSSSQKTEVISGLYGEDWDVSFSPDGTKIVYGNENDGIWVVNRNGTGNNQIYDGKISDWEERIIWAENDRIYFASYDGDVLSIKSDGTDLNKEGFGPCFDINPDDGSNLISGFFDIFSISQVPTYYIKGYVKNSTGTAISGVTVSCTGADSYTTSSSGYYEFTDLASGNYTVTPSKSGWAFTPSSKSYSPLSSNQSAQNFIGTEIIMQKGKVVEVRGGSKGYIKKDESASIVLNPTKSGTVKIEIYNLKGQKVWEKMKEVSSGVQDIVSWDCENTSNKVVASGIYIVQIKGAGIDVTKRIAVVK